MLRSQPDITIPDCDRCDLIDGYAYGRTCTRCMDRTRQAQATRRADILRKLNDVRWQTSAGRLTAICPDVAPYLGRRASVVEGSRP